MEETRPKDTSTTQAEQGDSITENNPDQSPQKAQPAYWSPTLPRKKSNLGDVIEVRVVPDL